MQCLEMFGSESFTGNSPDDGFIGPCIQYSEFDWSQLGCEVLFQVPDSIAPIDEDVRCPEWNEVGLEMESRSDDVSLESSDLLKAALDLAGITPEDGSEDDDESCFLDVPSCHEEVTGTSRKRKRDIDFESDVPANKIPRRHHRSPRPSSSRRSPSKSRPIPPIKRTMRTARPMRINLLKRRAQRMRFSEENDVCCDRECCLHWKWISLAAVYGDFS